MIETLASNARYDSAEEVKALLKTLREYKDARAHEQVVTVLGFLASTPAQMKTVCPALLDTYRDAAEQRERLRIIEVVSNIPSPDSVEFLRSAQQQSPPRDDTERAAFGFAFAKLSPRAEKPATSSP